MIAAAAAMAGLRQVGAAPPALTALEVAVRRRGAAFAGRQLVGVHRQAHGAARQPPFKSGVEEDLGQTLLLGLGADKARSGHDHGAQTRLDLLALQDRGRRPQILDPAIGAGSDEDRVDGWMSDSFWPGVRPM